MLDLNQLRKEFAQYLTENTTTRWGLDAALAHVARIAYEQGMRDAESGEPSNPDEATHDGCKHCNNPLFAGLKCPNCGKVRR